MELLARGWPMLDAHATSHGITRRAEQRLWMEMIRDITDHYETAHGVKLARDLLPDFKSWNYIQKIPSKKIRQLILLQGFQESAEIHNFLCSLILQLMYEGLSMLP